MSVNPSKFTFDLDLGRNAEKSALFTESALADRLAQARREGHAAGLAEGERTAQAKAGKQLAQAADALGARVAAIAAGMDDTYRHLEGEAVTLALSVARKLAGGLIAREPTGEIEALLADCLSSLGAVPHLVIRCAPQLADAVRDAATRRVQSSGFTGRLVVMGDPEIGLGDARIEWADGGLVRSTPEINADIDARIESYFAARGITPPSLEETEQ